MFRREKQCFILMNQSMSNLWSSARTSKEVSQQEETEAKCLLVWNHNSDCYWSDQHQISRGSLKSKDRRLNPTWSWRGAALLTLWTLLTTKNQASLVHACMHARTHACMHTHTKSTPVTLKIAMHSAKNWKDINQSNFIYIAASNSQVAGVTCWRQ